MYLEGYDRIGNNMTADTNSSEVTLASSYRACQFGQTFFPQSSKVWIQPLFLHRPIALVNK